MVATSSSKETAVRKLTHAILGCGRVAPNHVDGFRAVDGVEIRWACDRDNATAEGFGRANAIPRVTVEVAEVLADPEVTSVTVAVDHAQHAALAAAALRAGKHVLVEKPITLDVASARELAVLARQENRLLSVVSQHRYDPLVEKIKEWVDKGLLGRLVLCTVALHSKRTADYYEGSYWRGTWKGEGGSALVNQGYHCLDVAQWLCGSFSAHGAVVGSTLLDGVIETDETLGTILTGPDGLVATMAVTVSSTDIWRTRICLTGEAGTVEFDLDHPNRLHRCVGNAALEREAAAFNAAPNEDDLPAGCDYYGISHRRQIAEFCRSIRTGEGMSHSIEDAIDTLALIKSIYQSVTVHRSG
jgi:UDP-N-acetyl-2-amino-2-deoxyglucuronate dehydrogenase